MASRNVTSEIAGKVWKIEVQPGDLVEADDTVMILESMKVEITVLSPVSGRIQAIEVRDGEMVREGQVVAVIDL